MADKTELFAAYAAGATTPGLTLLVETHLEMRAESWAVVAGFEEVGGALLAEPEVDIEVAMSEGALDAALAALDAPAEQPSLAEPSPRSACLGMPARLAEVVGAPLEALDWRWRLGGVHEHVIDGFEGECVSLLRARPGLRVPHHGHAGYEATLVLRGALKDGPTKMTAGDFSLCDAEDDHHPEIAGDDLCYCLIVRDGALKLRTGLARSFRLF